MKPSRRRDSLEKAARKIVAEPLNGSIFERDGILTERIIRFAQRHGAKVRRETLREAAAVNAKCFHSCANCCSKINALKILSLTPRGPEIEPMPESSPFDDPEYT